MQFTSTIAAILATASLAFAAPTPNADVVSARASTWTLQSFTRTCNTANTSCAYKYGINTNDGSAVTSCAYTINGSAASRATYTNIKCGAFTIGSTWSGQFGPNQGFQTLSLVMNKQIIYPAYKDTELVNGKAVTPNKSFTPVAQQ